MGLITALISLLDKNLNLILLWLYNRKVDEVAKLETEVKTIKQETEIKTQEEKLAESIKDSENKVLAFRKKRKELSHEDK